MKPLLVSLISFTFFISSAQQFQVSISEKFNCSKVPEKIGDEFFNFDIDTKLQFGYTYKLYKTKYSAELIKYDKALRKIKEEKLANGERVYGPFPPFVKQIFGKLYFFYFEGNEKEEKIRFRVSEIDPATLIPGIPAELMTIEQKNVGLFGAFGMGTDFEPWITTSPDKSKLLFVWYPGNQNRIILSVTDNNFKVIRTVNENIKNSEKFDINNICLDNKGNAYIAYTYKLKDDPYSHILISKQEGKSADLEVKIPNAAAFNVYVMTTTLDNNIRVGGTYVEGSFNLAGAYFLLLNTSDFKLSVAAKSVFPRDLIDKFDNDGWAFTKSKNFGLSRNLHIKPFVLDDGTLNLLGEFRSTTTTTSMDPKKTTTRSYYHSGSLLNIHFKSDNKTIFSRIPKERTSTYSTMGDSFFGFPYKNQIIILYNDHVKNINQDIEKAPSKSDNYSNSVLVAATLNAEGVVKREIIIGQSKEDFLSLPENIKEFSLSGLYIPLNGLKALGRPSGDIKWATLEIK